MSAPRPHHWINPDGTCHAGDLFEHGSPAMGVYLADDVEQMVAVAEVRALRDLSDEESAELDRWMSDHMYQHSISNNVNGMSCHVGCRTQALGRGVSRVLRGRADRIAAHTDNE